MEKYSIKINENLYDVKILAIQSPSAEVEVNGVKYNVDISAIRQLGKTAPRPKKAVSSRQVVVAASAKSAPVSGSNDVVSPMPGKILKINVSEGNHVKAGDIVIIMEAMKMENQIKTHIDGTVAKIHVKPGDTVPEKAPLITIE